MTLAGFVLILNTRLAPSLVAVLLVAWIAVALRSILVQSEALTGFARIALRADGSAVATTRDGVARLSLVSGSLMLGHYAWLRFDGPGRRRVGVLVTAAELGATGWRRLNLFWRHGFKS